MQILTMKVAFYNYQNKGIDDRKDPLRLQTIGFVLVA
jgi:hypothetical protein